MASMSKHCLQKVRAKLQREPLNFQDVRALAAVALFTLGMVAPLAHAAWDNHQPAEYRGTAISADCALCESLAARMDGEAPLQSASSALVPLSETRTLVSMPSQPVFIGAQLGLRLSRAPPLQA
jgi:hypothetical protein